MKTSATLLFMLCAWNVAISQNIGDYRTKNSSGSWQSASSWEELSTFLLIIPTWINASSPPGSSTTVYVQSGHTINLNGATACGSISLSGTINLGSNTFTINGTPVYNTGGKIVSNGQSSMVLNGSGAASLTLDQTTSGTTNKLASLTINRGTTPANGTVTLTNALQVSNTVTLSAGTFQAAGLLTLLSTASQTARIATIDSTKASITGNITMQRYIPGGDRDWRFVCSPVTTTTGLNGAWQAGTYITGPVSTGGSICPSFAQNTNNGADPTESGNYSMYEYNPASDTWVPITNTLTTQLIAGKGFRLFFRGARSQGCSIIDGTNATPQAATLSATGAPGKGTIVTSLTNATSGWVLVGNPYPSAINWDASGWNTIRTSGANNISNSISIYNPLTNSYSAYVNGVSDGNGATNVISPGQSFFVKANNTTSVLTFRESYKTTGENNLFGKTSSEVPTLYIESGSSAYKDRLALYEDANTGDLFNQQLDAHKFALPPGGIAIRTLKDSMPLAIKSFSSTRGKDADTFLLRTRPFKTTEGERFYLAFNGAEKFAHTSFTLIDSHTGKSYRITRSDTVFYFTVLPGSGPENTNRFIMLARYNDQQATGIFATAKEDASKVRIYPNPLYGNTLTIESAGLSGVAEYQIQDISGKTLKSWQLDCSGKCEVEVDSLIPGTYILTIIHQQRSSRQLLIKQ